VFPLAHNPARVVRQGRHGLDFLHRGGDADSRDGFHFAQLLKRAVIMPGAVADPVARPVERRQRNEQNVGNDFLRLGGRFENAEPAALQPVAWGPCAKFQAADRRP